ncbi:MAG: amino acid racemase [Peptococcaceae bacterium]|nr:amino acid racemase [Peptococcaceae bacterium]
MRQAVGVIGGVGPMATVYYMQRVIEMTKAGCDQDHINMLVFNDCDIPDRTAFITEQSPDNPLPVMVEDAKRLEAAGCAFVVIPCNTAHYFYDELQQAVKIPVVNIVEETIRYAKERIADLQCVGIMATTGTIVTGTYQKYAQQAGLDAIVPDEDGQAALMHMIYDGVKAGQPVAREDFDAVANALRARGAQCLILGCTELSVLKRDLPIDDPDVLDSIDVLASETVRRSGKQYTSECLLKE